jgi:hypothetical protein
MATDTTAAPANPYAWDPDDVDVEPGPRAPGEAPEASLSLLSELASLGLTLEDWRTLTPEDRDELGLSSTAAESTGQP